ncbi:hypothetical protein HN832_03350 [archaeon]|jgi:thymidylate synthase ThyX|nr:hypothetical protein [archaeon]MBT4373567.1 hypothetical protein [archaeon]MBT4532015.1 hypothetical protein [archaeon]MBT7001682.1 hypothetical protein [archaeon]MBT7282426.1 hypothetical protein [archaeon]
MRGKIEATPNGIDNLKDALRFCQNFARFCYSEKTIEEVGEEEYNKILMEKVLINRGHHSPLEQFTINYVFEDLPKALAMVLNNQKFGGTTEKSARYTFIPEDLEPKQREKYMKWHSWFQGGIEAKYPESEFPKLYKKGSDGKTPVKKLSQENARYMGSVFIPTRMGHKMDLAYLNKVVYGFKQFIKEERDTPNYFKGELIKSMQKFIELPEVQRFTYQEGFPQKGGLKLNLFGPANEINYGESVYSANDIASFASLAQRHRHRTIDHHIIAGYSLGAPLGFFVPPLVEENNKIAEWRRDLYEIAKGDIPQGQLVRFGFSGNTRELPMMTSERECNNAQLETNIGITKFLKRYAKEVPEIRLLIKPDCQKEGCPRGGCYLGPAEYGKRMI